VLIVDDCSDTTGPDNLPGPVHVHRNETNQGYVRSVNIGFSHLDTDIVVVLDSDAEPLMDFVPGVREAFENISDLGAMALYLVDREGNPTGAVTPEPTVPPYLLGQRASGWFPWWRPNGLPAPERMCLHSCGMAVRRAAFEEVGGFDEEFDFLDADIDFSMRLRQAGWSLRKSDDIVAYHEGGGSPQSNAKRTVRHHRSRWRLLRKHGKLRYPFLARIILALRHGVEYSVFRLAGPLITQDTAVLRDKLAGKQTLIRGVWSGYRDVAV
jgi:GT2 family glycosyltransferase